jgi:translation initiation factor IF-3
LPIAKALRLNEEIRISPVRLIDQDNEQRGIVSVDEAQTMARELGLDLVEVAPLERPPVCRIMDYGKFKYQQKKKLKARQVHQLTLKEVRMRPKTDDNDRGIKVKRARRFLEEGHKVQFTMLFRGRERFHQDIGRGIFESILATLGEEVKVERPPRSEGNRLIMIVTPAKHN